MVCCLRFFCSPLLLLLLLLPRLELRWPCLLTVSSVQRKRCRQLLLRQSACDHFSLTMPAANGRQGTGIQVLCNLTRACDVECPGRSQMEHPRREATSVRFQLHTYLQYNCTYLGTYPFPFRRMHLSFLSQLSRTGPVADADRYGPCCDGDHTIPLVGSRV
ncbi:hypothetical protein F5Y08DRAFT_198538 [Xylaria arbuscula]|nr:hypothetical protein F5Y08DRAFT_198538 [Xylaria arbuscula]